jgi:[acyl-carrier-protein] S-malonyltransferase
MRAQMHPISADGLRRLLQLGPMDPASTLAFVFPGQGSQAVGMARTLAEAFPVARRTFEEVGEAVGVPIDRLAWDGPADELDLTVNAQPAILAASIAYLRALETDREAAGLAPLRPAFCAGHSMGQYSALVAAGALDLADAARLVRERGRLMQAAAAQGAMAAIIGLSEERLPDLREAGRLAGPFEIANRNAPGQVVVSGTRAAVEAGMAAAGELGARRAVLLPVSVAAHSPLMEPAASGMRDVLAGAAFRDPNVPLLANADARPLATAEACRAELVEHLTNGVDWIAAVRRMTAAGVTTFVEVGPGRVLSGLIRRIEPTSAALAVDDAAAANGLAAAVLDPNPAPSRAASAAPA